MRLAKSLGIAVVASLLVVGGLAWHWRDPRMGSEAAARALRAKVGGGPYTCHRVEFDGTIVDMKDLDYSCGSANTHDLGYWIGTNSHAITDLQPSG